MAEPTKPTFLQWLATRNDPEYQAYLKRGGESSYNTWLKAGKPEQDMQLTAYAKSRLPEDYTLPSNVRVASTEPGERIKIAQRKAEDVLTKISPEIKPSTTGFEPPPFPTSPPPQGYRWEWDSSTMRYVPVPLPKPEPTSKSPLPTIYPEIGVNPYDDPTTSKVEGYWNKYTGQWEAPPGWVSPQQQWQQEQTRLQQETETKRWQEQMQWNRDQAQMQQTEQERQYRSQLATQPMSWLQYASYTGETPVTQPWMLPLMSGQYAGQAGQQLPGWSKESGAGLPSLLNPSAQYWARMGPTSQQQYMGYQQAKTGARPEETQFRLRSAAPPGGRFGRLAWAR